MDNFADISFPRFQQLSSLSLHYPGFPVQTNCRHPPFNHTFARKRRSSRCLWTAVKNTGCKKKKKNAFALYRRTTQTNWINISISFAMFVPLQGSLLWRKRLEWSQQVNPALALTVSASTSSRCLQGKRGKQPKRVFNIHAQIERRCGY